MNLVLPTGAVREWRLTDAASLAKHANDRRIWRNLRDRFPHPYSLADADAFIAMALAMEPMTMYAMLRDELPPG